MDMRDILQRTPVIPVLTLYRIEQALPLAEALLEGGLPVLEITLRSPAALPAIERLARSLPDAIIGAGTVLDAATYESACNAGARFIVSPGHTTALLDAAAGKVPLLPGACTPAEVMRLLEYGIQCMKFFPAEPAGGIPMLKALAAPLPQARFCPTGGISAALAPDYLALPNVLCVGGSWMAGADLIEAGDWQRIRALAARAADLARKT